MHQLAVKAAVETVITTTNIKEDIHSSPRSASGNECAGTWCAFGRCGKYIGPGEDNPCTDAASNAGDTKRCVSSGAFGKDALGTCLCGSFGS